MSDNELQKLLQLYQQNKDKFAEEQLQKPYPPAELSSQLPITTEQMMAGYYSSPQFKEDQNQVEKRGGMAGQIYRDPSILAADSKDEQIRQMKLEALQQIKAAYGLK